MKDLYLATYSFGPLKLTKEEMCRTAAELGFCGLEFLTPLTSDTAALLQKYGLRVVDSMESPGLDGSLANIDLLHSLGVRYIAGTSLGAVGSRQQALQTAEALERAGQRLAAEGFKLYYHNHTHEWRMEEGEYLVETLLKHTDAAHVCLQLDAGWATCAGVDVAAFIRKYPGRVEMMHVKASTGVLGPEGVPMMPPPPPGFIPDGPPVPSPEMEAAMAGIKAASGPMRDSLLDYSVLMPIAQEHGCQAFILERDEQYVPDAITCIREDITELRRFW